MKRTSIRSRDASRGRPPAGAFDSAAPGIANHARVERTLEAVKLALDRGRVGFVVLKGPQVSGLYEDPYSRLMSDLDILVREADFRKAARLLSADGFTAKAQYPGRARSGDGYSTALFAYGGVFWVELHRDIAPHGRYNVDLEGMFERSVPFRFGRVEARGLAAEDLLLSLCIHIAKDYFTGVDRKHFADVAVLLGRMAIDWDVFAGRARSAGAASASYYVLLAASRQFGALVPQRVLSGMRPSVLRRLWLERYIDTASFPVYRFPEHKGLGIQLRMAMPLMDGLFRGQLAFLRYAFLRAGDIAAGLKTNPPDGGHD